MSSARVRLLLILPAVAAVVWLIPESPTKGPTLMILLGLPLIFGLVPKNWLYGLRTLRTLRSSDEVWYIQNKITGVAMLAVGLVWLVMVLR
jgi:hypothetical protein